MMGKNIGVLPTLLHSRHNFGKDILNNLTELESFFNKLAAIELAMTEKMPVGILLMSLAEVERLSSTVSALETKEADKLTW